MAPNTTWTVRLTVRVTAPSGTVIAENAATLADTPDPNSANNTATASIKVQYSGLQDKNRASMQQQDVVPEQRLQV
jgi:hypothetical protein